MLSTRTGNFSIGFRRGWSNWQKDLAAVLQWAKDNELGVLDVGKDGTETVLQVLEAGLQIGSVDALNWQGWMSPDAAKRADAVAQNQEYIEACAKMGVKNFFCVLLPEKPENPRAENFALAVESLGQMMPTLEENDARLVIEGYPGAGALCCTPEGLRRLFHEIPSHGLGLNYDPSHLLRMKIDPLRFLREFVGRVGHVHGKDTEILADKLYELGTEQPATFALDPAFGGAFWRYTIPGQGQTNWAEVFRILSAHHYAGAVSIELEDADYNGTEDGEKRGILAGARFLSDC